MQNISSPWPARNVVEELVDKYSGYFIYASTIIKFIGDENYRPTVRLAMVQNTNSPGSESAYDALDQLYMTILSSAPRQSELTPILCAIGMQRIPYLGPEDWTEVARERDAHSDGDGDGPTMACEYTQRYLRDVELNTMPNPNHTDDQLKLTWEMRGVLNDWLIQLQLVGVVCLLVAAKFEEIISPSIATLIFVCDHAYTCKDILQAEQHVLSALNWDLSPVNYLHCISKADGCDPRIRTLARYLAEIACVEHRLLSAPPSLVAAAAMWLAHLALVEEEAWTAVLAHCTTYAEDALVPVATHMLQYVLHPIRQENFYKNGSAHKATGKNVVQLGIKQTTGRRSHKNTTTTATASSTINKNTTTNATTRSSRTPLEPTSTNSTPERPIDIDDETPSHNNGPAANLYGLAPVSRKTSKKRERAQTDDNGSDSENKKAPKHKRSDSGGLARRNAEAGTQISRALDNLSNALAQPLVTSDDLSYIDKVVNILKDSILLPDDPRGKLYRTVSRALSTDPALARVFILEEDRIRRIGMLEGILEDAGLLDV
ncbi:cyclin-like protein [Mycena olivaceomarginata]|nr:cyclin-like protein [Mycena olivaceomarginata]